MTDNLPDDEFFENIDWSQMEYLANEGSLEGAPESGAEEGYLTQEMLAKRLAWDVSPCGLAAEVSRFLGLSEASGDVLDMEHRQSHARLDEVLQLAPFIHQFSGHATRGIVAAVFLANGADEGVDSPAFVEATEKLSNAIFQAAYSVVAELVSIGAVEMAGIVVTPEEFRRIMEEAHSSEEGDESE